MKCKILFKITRETFALDVFAVLLLATYFGIMVWDESIFIHQTASVLFCELVATLPFRLGEL